jgi:hypothetical protein
LLFPTYVPSIFNPFVFHFSQADYLFCPSNFQSTVLEFYLNLLWNVMLFGICLDNKKVVQNQNLKLLRY